MIRIIFTCTIDVMRRVLFFNSSMVDGSLFVDFSLNELTNIGDCDEVRQIYGVLGRFVTYRRPGSFLVDTFPSLASIPLFNIFSNWQRIGAEIHKADSEVFLSFWNQMLEE